MNNYYLQAVIAIVLRRSVTYGGKNTLKLYFTGEV